MAYTAIPDSWVDTDSPLREDLFERLRDNPLAIALGSVGAPRIQSGAIADGAIDQAALASGAVHQSELDTSNGQVSRVGAASSLRVLPGGAFGFYPQTSNSAAATGTAQIFRATSATSQATYIYLTASTGTTVTAYQEYINSSPPFNLGDGDIPFFVFIEMKAGVIVGSYMADVPPWAYNGPTDISGKASRDGVKFQRMPEIKAELLAQGISIQQAIKSGLFGRAELAGRLANDRKVSIEITQTIKNLDMALIPHPFPDSQLSDVILLDPMSAEMEQIKALHKTREFDLDILKKEMILNNTAMVRKAPEGVSVHKISWKNTGR